MKYSIATGAIQDKNYISKVMTIVVATLLSISVVAVTAQAKPTTVPGHSKNLVDVDGNKISDAGVLVNGHYNSYYFEDASGAYYWDLGDGRIQTSEGVTNVDDLDEATLTECEYVVNYRGDFGNTPSLDTGWISNNITCKGFSGTSSIKYLIVHESDPRYTGNTDWKIWGNWEYHTYTVSGSGNLTKIGPQTNN